MLYQSCISWYISLNTLEISAGICFSESLVNTGPWMKLQNILCSAWQCNFSLPHRIRLECLLPLPSCSAVVLHPSHPSGSLQSPSPSLPRCLDLSVGLCLVTHRISMFLLPSVHCVLTVGTKQINVGIYSPENHNSSFVASYVRLRWMCLFSCWFFISLCQGVLCVLPSRGMPCR